ncbi:MAG: hypothetical protein PHT99_02380 [Methanoregula sp.]|nr:hypothetical protein [Methanoregula sp.]
MAAAAFYLFRGRTKTRDPDKTVVFPSPRHPEYQPGAQPISPVPKKSIPEPVQRPDVLPQPKEVSVVDGITDITGSFRALVEKYSLDQFTLATADGLVFASGGGESAQTDAARYSELFTNDPLAETPGIVLFGFTHKGSDLVGIIRTNLRIPEEIARMIENDTKDILNRWI